MVGVRVQSPERVLDLLKFVSRNFGFLPQCHTRVRTREAQTDAAEETVSLFAQLGKQFLSGRETRAVSVQIRYFILRYNIHSIDGKFADRRSKPASAPNRGSPPPAKGKRNTSCLYAFKMLSLD